MVVMDRQDYANKAGIIKQPGHIQAHLQEPHPQAIQLIQILRTANPKANSTKLHTKDIKPVQYQ